MKQNIIAALIALATLSAGCSTPEETPATLTVSETALEFGKTAEARTLSVQTGTADWHAFSNCPWLTVEHDGVTLTLSAAENDTPRPRMASVLVLAGPLSQTVEVVQLASEERLELSDAPLVFDCRENVQSLDVSAWSTRDWTAVSDAAWIHLIPRSDCGRLTVAVDPNPSETERAGKVFLTLGTQGKEVSVVQKGSRYFLLPLLTYGAPLGELFAFERSRGGYCTGCGPDLVRWWVWHWQLSTPSDIFPTLMYTMHCGRLYGAEVQTPLCDDAFLSDFGAWLHAQGFEDTGAVGNGPGSTRSYSQRQEASLARITLFVGAEMSLLNYCLQPVQTEPQSTLAGVPWGMNDFTADAGRIKAWEKTQGGHLAELPPDRLNPSLLYFLLPKNQGISRYYWLNGPEGTVREAVTVLPGWHQAFFRSTLTEPQTNGTFEYWYPTREFEALMGQEGFVYYRQVDEGMRSEVYFYYNAAKKLSAAVYADMQGDLQFHLFPYTPPGTSGTAADPTEASAPVREALVGTCPSARAWLEAAQKEFSQHGINQK